MGIQEGNTENTGKSARTTVVIPNYNGINYIENCLDSLAKGSRVPYIIVVDNGSRDGSLERIMQRYTPDSYPYIEIISLPENTGFCHAVNLGIQKAGTEYVFLLNNDTVVEEHCVEELERFMDDAPCLFGGAAKMVSLQEPDRTDDAGDFYCALGWAFARGKDKPADRYQRDGIVFAACAGAAIYRRKLFEKVGLFDEAHFAYLEDIDIGYRANLAGYRNGFAHRAVVRHAGSGVTGSRHNPFKVRLSARNSVYLISKNMPLLQVVLNLPFLLLGFLVKCLFFTGKGMGKAYVRGLGEGVRLAFSREGRRKKVRFCPARLSSYLWVQWELWAGIVRYVF